MSAIELRSSIFNLLEETRDEEVLEAYYQILIQLLRVQKQPFIGFDAEGLPLSDEDLRSAVRAAQQRISSGKSIRHSEAQKQAETW